MAISFRHINQKTLDQNARFYGELIAMPILGQQFPQHCPAHLSLLGITAIELGGECLPRFSVPPRLRKLCSLRQNAELICRASNTQPFTLLGFFTYPNALATFIHLVVEVQGFLPRNKRQNGCPAPSSIPTSYQSGGFCRCDLVGWMLKVKINTA